MFQFKTLRNSTINEKGTPKCTKRVVGQQEENLHLRYK